MFPRDPFATRRPQRQIDVMQVCRTGHVITERLLANPEYGEAHCSRCGQPTLSQCESCGTTIPGFNHASSVVVIGRSSAPKHCAKCGGAFPWTVTPEGKELGELIALVEKLVELTGCSIPGLSTHVRGQVGIPNRAAANRDLALWSFFVSLQSTYGSQAGGTPESVKPGMEALGSLLRGVEAALEELKELLGIPNSDGGKALAEYGTLRERYNTLTARYDYARTKTGLSPLGFTVAEAFADIPKRSRVSGGAYSVGEAFHVYSDVKELVASAMTSVFVVDPYPNEELFDLYLAKAAPGVSLRLLVARTGSKTSGEFLKVGKKFSSNPQVNLEVRQAPKAKLHDRTVFIDGTAYVLGQSIKDAANSQPTYLTILRDPKWLKSHEDTWSSANVLTF